MDGAGARWSAFDYELHRAGWATATFRLSLDAEPLHVPVSYLHDSLSDFARALHALDSNPREISVPFVDEPGTVQLVMRRPDSERLELDLWRFSEWITRWPPSPDAPSEHLGSATFRWRTFRGGVVSVLQRLLRAYGLEGYRDRWVAHPFPIDELKAFENADPPRGS